MCERTTLSESFFGRVRWSVICHTVNKLPPQSKLSWVSYSLVDSLVFRLLCLLEMHFEAESRVEMGRIVVGIMLLTCSCLVRVHYLILISSYFVLRYSVSFHINSSKVSHSSSQEVNPNPNSHISPPQSQPPSPTFYPSTPSHLTVSYYNNSPPSAPQVQNN
ncbi:hypothetical protein ES702_03653 [subsurface metagenome]